MTPYGVIELCPWPYRAKPLHETAWPFKLYIGPTKFVNLKMFTQGHLGSPGVIYYNDVKMSAMASQITSLTNVCSTGYSGADQGKHQSSASLAFMQGIHRGPVNFPHKWPVTRKMFPFDDVIMNLTHVLDFKTCTTDKTHRNRMGLSRIITVTS